MATAATIAASSMGIALACVSGVRAGGYEVEPDPPVAAAPPAPAPTESAIVVPSPDPKVALELRELPESLESSESSEPPDPAARLPGGSEGSEYWDLLATLESGHLVFARFLLTNVGPGDHSAVVLGNVIAPDGTRIAFRNGRRREKWQLSDDHLTLDINKCHLDLRDGSALLTVRKPSVALSLRFALAGGARPPDGLVPDRYAFEILAANAPVSGTLALAGQPPIETTGTGAVSHTWTSDPEEKRIQRRLDFFTLTPGLGLQLSEFRTPAGEIRRWLRATRDGRTVLESSSVALEASGQLAGTPRGYPIEAKLALAGEAANGDLTLVQLLHQHDPLDAIPQPLRSVIRWSVSMEPHQVWTRASYDLSLQLTPGAAPTPLRGEGLAMIAFLNEE